MIKQWKPLPTSPRGGDVSVTVLILQTKAFVHSPPLGEVGRGFHKKHTTMTDILQEIVAHKRIEVERMKREMPADTLRAIIERATGEPVPSLKAALKTSTTGIIAEFKRRSPSKGWLNESAQAAEVPLEYQLNGAAAISILTDVEFFGGSDGFITEARKAGVTLPVLYKNFIVDEYQLLKARLCGASAVLLIASVLGREECKRLMDAAHGLGLEVLLELHGEDELGYAELCPDVCGVNNRNLGTFATDVANSLRMAERLPKELCKISESGISDVKTAARLRAAGYDGFLIGESFMREEHPGRALRRFVFGLDTMQTSNGTTPRRVKVCGMTEPGNALAVARLGVDMVGFILSKASPRHASPQHMKAVCAAIDGMADCKRRPMKVGVFVNEATEGIVSAAKEYGLDCIQMHGNETAWQLIELRAALSRESLGSVLLIKAVSVAEREDVERATEYTAVADLLLFDAKGKAAGGNGTRFSWDVLKAYRGTLPFILSGGISPECAADIAAFKHPKFAGIDLNSRFETAPGVKNTIALEQFIDEIKDLTQQKTI